MKENKNSNLSGLPGLPGLEESKTFTPSKINIEPKKVKDNKGKYKRSGHLTDQILKYTYPKENRKQLSIFDSLRENTQNQILESKTDKNTIVWGIKLTPSQTKVIDSLCKLLHNNSQTFNPKLDDYYRGNKGLETVTFSGNPNTQAPRLGFTLYQLTKEYKGGETITGKDVENVKQILSELDKKQFLLSYTETTKTAKGGRIENKIEDFRKLIIILKLTKTEYSNKNIELSKKEETLIVLNPIFNRQINSKFILYPNDINKRTAIAYGSQNVSGITLRLRDYLMRLQSSPVLPREILLERLYYLLAEKWMKERRRKKVKEYTDKALDVVINLGLLKSYKIIPSKTTGEPKIIFTINKDFE